MAEKVAFDLVSPEELLLSDAVDMVVVPGTEGDFGVLPGHAPLISLVRPGVIDVWDGGKISRRLFVAGGFAEVTTERCTVLADEALPIEQIDRAEAESRLKDLREDLGDAKEEADREAIEAAIAVLEAKLKAAAEARAP